MRRSEKGPRFFWNVANRTVVVLSTRAEAAEVADELEYSGHWLVVVEQPGGGFLVEIAPLGGPQTIRTMTYQSSREAIAAAKRTIDQHPQHRRLVVPAIR
jgi:hypothetical protein